MEPIDIPNVIRATQLEESDTIKYYAACVVYLREFLLANVGLGSPEIRDRVELLFRWFTEAPVDNENPPGDYLRELCIDLLLFGMIGKALFFLQGRSSGQFAEEVTRMFEHLNQLRSNTWLFHTAAQLAQVGFDIRFIPDKGQVEKRPDYRATRQDITIFVEANARTQAYQDIQDIQNLLWTVLHGGESGKAVKFISPEYDPGVIVVDISRCNPYANSTGLLPQMKLKPSAFVYRSPDFSRFIYDVTTDPEFFAMPENTGNVVECAIRYFQRVDKKKYHVRGLLVGSAMRIVIEGDRVSSPKGAFMVVDHRYPQLAIQALSPAIYLVDAEPPDIPELGS